jgi:hypothetical protein
MRTVELSWEDCRMSDQDLVAQVAELRARQDETDESFLDLGDAIEDILTHLEDHSLAGRVSTRLAFEGLREVIAAVKQRHQRTRES